jgi:hypothetical protein
MLRRMTGGRLRVLLLVAIPVASVLLASRHLTTDFHKEIDWDMAFSLGLVRAGRPTCCLHPLLDVPLALYRAFAALTGNHLLALQLFFCIALVLGAVLYGVVFHSLFRSLALSLLAAAAYPMFPLVQNLLSYFEDNLVKLPLLLGVFALILWDDADGKPWGPYLAIALFMFTCLVAVDALSWAPFIVALILWRRITVASERPRHLLLFGTKCLLVAITSLVLITWSHDVAYRAVILRPTLEGLASTMHTVGSASDWKARQREARSAPARRMREFLIEPLEPLFGLEHITGLTPKTADPRLLRRFVERLKERPGLGNITIVFLAVQVMLFMLAMWQAGRRRDAARVTFIAIVLLNFVLQFGLNFAFVDRPNERYDHYVLQLPFILASYVGAFESVRLRRSIRELVTGAALSCIIVIGIAHHVRSPYRMSLLYRLQAAFPGDFAEYYFSLRELRTTSAAEAAFLAGYAPLRIVNVDGSRRNFFFPMEAFMERRDAAAVRRYLRAHEDDVYVSPGLRSFLEEK